MKASPTYEEVEMARVLDEATVHEKRMSRLFEHIQNWGIFALICLIIQMICILFLFACKHTYCPDGHEQVEAYRCPILLEVPAVDHSCRDGSVALQVNYCDPVNTTTSMDMTCVSMWGAFQAGMAIVCYFIPAVAFAIHYTQLAFLAAA